MTGLTFERREAEEALWVGIPVAWLIAVVGGLWLASSGLRPLTEMAGRAASIPVDTTQDLGAPRRDDEIGQLTTSFNALVGRLRQALSVQRQFMADASHELRTPVSVIQAAADVTLGRPRREEVEYREALQIAGDQARRLGRLVDDMLVLARADAGGYPLRLAPLDLDDLIVDACRSIDPLARARGVSLHLDRTSGIRIEGDEELLSRMLINLLQNGVRHTSPGSDVSVSIASTANQATIRITDHGSGVAEPDRGRIFERFVRVDPSRTGGGAGLGLPIARWIAEAHGGALALEQSGPAGSTFVVFLPVAAPDPPLS
jgi:signal transduction histidine kinase